MRIFPQLGLLHSDDIFLNVEKTSQMLQVKRVVTLILFNHVSYIFAIVAYTKNHLTHPATLASVCLSLSLLCVYEGMNSISHFRDGTSVYCSKPESTRNNLASN